MNNQPAESDGETIEAELVGSDTVSREEHDAVSDLVIGFNLRVSDNVIQALTILICVAIGAGIGALGFEQRLFAGLAGAFIGLVLGLLGSGLVMAIYQAWRHLRRRP